jgi:hypothetical protein
MGGDYYDRDVATSTSNNGVSEEAKLALGNQTEVHSSCKPLRWTDENLIVECKNPIVFALDVTGSMGDWAKIIYDKMPMFYGQIKMQDYLQDPAISFCAIGDHTCDDLPLQVTEFGQGKAIDQLLSKLVLWKSGNGNEHESYELAAYFFDNNVEMMGVEMPFFFITGDEGYFDQINSTTVQTVFGKGLKHETIESATVWRSLMQKFNVFHIHKPYTSANYESRIHKQWCDLLGPERVLDITVPKACVDVVLGAIALTSGKTLNQYIQDMKERGQDQERIEMVTNALAKYAQKLNSKEIIPVTYEANLVDNIQINSNNNNSNDISGSNQSGKSPNQTSSISVDEIRNLIAGYEKLILDDFDNDELQIYNNIKSFRKSHSCTVPKEFLCPLTNEIFHDPVMTCDGASYERKAIESWLEKSEISPLSKSKLDTKILLPNFALKQLIRDYLVENKVI